MDFRPKLENCWDQMQNSSHDYLQPQNTSGIRSYVLKKYYCADEATSELIKANKKTKAKWLYLKHL